MIFFFKANGMYYQIAIERWCWVSLCPPVNGSAHFLTCWQCLAQYYHSEKSFPLTCLRVFKCVGSVPVLCLLFFGGACPSYSYVLAPPPPPAIILYLREVVWKHKEEIIWVKSRRGKLCKRSDFCLFVFDRQRKAKVRKQTFENYCVFSYL